jgi:hypothetical protein
MKNNYILQAFIITMCCTMPVSMHGMAAELKKYYTVLHQLIAFEANPVRYEYRTNPTDYGTQIDLRRLAIHNCLMKQFDDTYEENENRLKEYQKKLKEKQELAQQLVALSLSDTTSTKNKENTTQTPLTQSSIIRRPGKALTQKNNRTLKRPADTSEDPSAKRC